MKVLMTTDNIGGVWTFAIELAAGLQRNDVEVVLAVIGEPLTDVQKDQLTGIPYRHFNARQEWMENPWENVYASGKWLLWLKELENPDIMHLNSYTLGCLDWQIPVVMTMHSCVLSWWEAVKNEPAPEAWKAYHDHVRAGIQSADMVTAPGSFMLKSAEKHYGTLKNKKLIFNGRSSSLFHLGVKEKLVFSMGRLWDEAKNVKLLIEAAEKINHPVFIAGDMPEENTVQVPPNVEFLGKLSQQQVASWLSKAWVYALPVKYEPFGYSFLEAAFSGCVLVGGNIPSLHEIWNDAMLYANTTDPDQLADTINGVLDNDWQLNHMSNKAYTCAHENYREERMVKEYLNMYKSMGIYKRKILHI